MGVRFRQLGLLVLLVAAAGCTARPTGPPDTGARATAEAFFDALIRQDWQHAYDALHPDSRASLDLEHFTRLAMNYRRHLGFEPATVHVRACEEHGAEAIAHVVLTGQGQGKVHEPYKDAATLRTTAAGWGVVLSPQFGRQRG